MAGIGEKRPFPQPTAKQSEPTKKAGEIAAFEDLSGVIEKSKCNVLNAANPDALLTILGLQDSGGTTVMKSDCDEQLLISVAFNPAVKLHSVSVTGGPEGGPTSIRLYANAGRELDFDDMESLPSTQTLELTRQDISSGQPVPVKYVKFQDVLTLALFVPANFDGSDETCIQRIKLIGAPKSITDMKALTKQG